MCYTRNEAPRALRTQQRMKDAELASLASLRFVLVDARGLVGKNRDAYDALEHGRTGVFISIRKFEEGRRSSSHSHSYGAGTQPAAALSRDG
jgi:hypothetical protein